MRVGGGPHESIVVVDSRLHCACSLLIESFDIVSVQGDRPEGVFDLIMVLLSIQFLLQDGIFLLLPLQFLLLLFVKLVVVNLNEASPRLGLLLDGVDVGLHVVLNSLAIAKHL